MESRVLRRLRLVLADPVVMRSMRWGALGAATFLGGLALGVTRDGIAIGITLGIFFGLTPLLVFAGLLYNFRSDSQSALPSFKSLLVIMLVCWASVDVLALGAFAFAWSAPARLAFLLVSAVAIALLIFSQFVKPQERSVTPLDDGLMSHEP